MRRYHDLGGHGFFPALEQAIRVYHFVHKSQPVKTLGPKDVYLTESMATYPLLEHPRLE